LAADCTLTLRTEHFKLELEGDEEFVCEAYSSVRESVLGRLKPTGVSSAALHSLQGAPGQAPRNTDDSEFVWVYVCNELYSKVQAVSRERLEGSAFGRILDPWRLGRISFDSEDAPLLKHLVPSGQTLWSELTELGRQRLRPG